MKIGGKNLKLVSKTMGLGNHKIVFLRHGESQWNLENRFTGWTDIDLSEKGIKEAKNAGILLKKEGFDFNFVFTSVLKRAVHTMELCLGLMKIVNIPTKYDWRLNERHYGSLQGLNKSEMAKKYGDKQVLLWRRSYKTAPPMLTSNDKRHPKFDPKYQNLEESKLPSGESLKDTVNRVIPLWENTILPKINSGRKILIVAHGNSIRAIVKIIDRISNDDIIDLNIPTGTPLIYELDNKLNTTKKYYLGDPKDIKKNVGNVINQGKSN